MLASALAQCDLAVGIVAFDGTVGLRSRVGAVDVIALPVPHTHVPIVRTLIFYAQTARTLRDNPAEVFVQYAAGIHTTLVALVARALRRRFVYATAGVHDFDLGTWEPRRWVVWAYRLGVRLADQVIVQTPEQVELCRSRFGREPVLIKSIAEPAPARTERPGAFLWIGRLSGHKQPEAYVKLARSVPEARFQMIAVDPREPSGARVSPALARMAEGVPNLQVLAPRPRAELAPLIERAVAIVSTSKSEGMPNVFMEGWSRGVPALTLAHDPDGVIDRERLGGYANGSPARMAELAREMWEGRADTDELAGRCRDYVAREHALAPIVHSWIAALGLTSAGSERHCEQP